VAGATPYQPYGGGQSYPRPLGVVRPPRKATKKKQNKMGLSCWGWPGHPQGPGGGFGPYDHTQALGGGPATPNSSNPFRFFFFSWWPFGVAGPPPKAWGGFGHPHTAGMGWPKPPLGQKWSGSSHPGRDFSPPPPFF
jgi:hypothetical protein